MSPRRAPSRGRPLPETLPPRGARLGLVVLRLWTGAFFLATAWWKLVEEGFGVGEKIAWFRDQEYVPTIRQAIQHPPELLGRPMTWFAAFLEDVMLPAADVLAPALLFFEALLGLSLVLGLGVRLTATLGFLMMLAFTLAKPQPGQGPDEPVGVLLVTVHSANWPVTLILFALALCAAGRTLGLDRPLRARGPRWLRWTA